jgi:probable rRNA maturation factor
MKSNPGNFCRAKASVEIRQDCKTARLSVKRLSNLARFFLCRLERLSPRLRWDAISVLFTDDAAISDIKRRYFGDEGTTDVISFSYRPLAGGKGHTGDIVVNIEEARRRRLQHRGWTRAKELALYLAHGFDHLSGADDATPGRRRAMRRRDLAWVRLAAKHGLLNGLLNPRRRQ